MQFYKKAITVSLFLPFLLVQKPVGVVTFEQLQNEASTKQNDTLYVVNFWATWCDPCVHEIPYFQKVYSKFSARKVKMIFVSLNAVRELTKVQQFADSKNLLPEVLVLNGGNPNNWIDKVDSSWSGSIPATVLYKHGKKLYFHEGELTEDSLTSVIQTKNK
jgi:thiol-disulfide isomerase/thioredoxin